MVAFESYQDLLVAIVANAQDAILSKDLNAVVTSWNPACERIYGFSAEEVVGKQIFGFIPPETVAELKEVLSKVEHGQSVDHFETVRKRRNGEVFLASLSVSPLRNAQGEIVGSSSVVRDITKEREKSVKLASSMLGAFEALKSTVEAVIPIAKELSEKGLPDIG